MIHSYRYHSRTRSLNLQTLLQAQVRENSFTFFDYYYVEEFCSNYELFMIYYRAFFHSENVCNLLLLDHDLAPSCEDQWNLCLAREGYIEYVASWELNWCPGEIAGNPDRLYRWPQCCYHPETQNPSGDLEGCLFKYASKQGGRGCNAFCGLNM